MKEIKQRKEQGRARMKDNEDQILRDLIAKALSLGADELEVEYKHGKEEVAAMKGPVGFGIASIDASSPEARPPDVPLLTL